MSETLTRTVAENTVLSLGVQDDQERRVAKRLRTRAVERLWNLTEELNVLYRDNWTALADREMMRYVLYTDRMRGHRLVCLTS